MKSQNFEFLRRKHPELADLGGFAETYARPDPGSALFNLRRFIEHVVGLIYAGYRLPRPCSDNLIKYVTAEKFEEIRRSDVCAGDVLITTKGTVGDVCLMPELDGPAVLSATGTVRPRLPEDYPILGEFVVSQITQPTYKRYIHTFEAGSAQQYLNLSGIRRMVLMVPPQNKQHAFCDLKLQVRLLRERMGQAAAKVNDLFSSLVYRAFCGQLARGISSKKTQLEMFTDVRNE